MLTVNDLAKKAKVTPARIRKWRTIGLTEQLDDLEYPDSFMNEFQLSEVKFIKHLQKIGWSRKMIASLFHPFVLEFFPFIISTKNSELLPPEDVFLSMKTAQFSDLDGNADLAFDNIRKLPDSITKST